PARRRARRSRERGRARPERRTETDRDGNAGCWEPEGVSDWFLPESERAWTAGNVVVPRVHGATYFARLVELIGATGAGDRIFFTDWRGDSDERLTEDGPTVAELLRDAAARDVEV